MVRLFSQEFNRAHQPLGAGTGGHGYLTLGGDTALSKGDS